MDTPSAHDFILADMLRGESAVLLEDNSNAQESKCHSEQPDGDKEFFHQMHNYSLQRYEKCFDYENKFPFLCAFSPRMGFYGNGMV